MEYSKQDFLETAGPQGGGSGCQNTGADAKIQSD